MMGLLFTIYKNGGVLDWYTTYYEPHGERIAIVLVLCTYKFSSVHQFDVANVRKNITPHYLLRRICPWTLKKENNGNL